MDTIFDKPFLYLLGAAVFKHISIYAIWHSRNRLVKHYAGKLSEIRLYPVKSCRVMMLETADCSESGLSVTTESGWVARDRHWMVVKEMKDGTYEFLTARTENRLTMVQTSLKDNDISLNAPYMDTLVLPQMMKKREEHVVISATVWGDHIECIDGGDAAAAWFCRYLGRGNVRVVHAAIGLPRRQVNQTYPGAKPSDNTVFQDGYPYMLMSEASLAELNSRLEKPVPMDNFRPNLVASGCLAYDEDLWDEVHIGEVIFRNVKPCQRCIMTTVNPSTGKRHPGMQPLRTLRTYRKVEKFGDDPLLGVNFVVDQPGRLKVGDSVYVTLKN